MRDRQSTPAAPWHLWVAGGLLLIWHGMAVLDYIITVTRYEPFLVGHPKEVLQYYFDAPAWMYVMWGAASFGGFLSSVFLLLRRKAAVLIAFAGWACAIVAAVYTYINPPPEGGAGVTMYVIVIMAALFVLLYMMWLSRRGFLN